MENGSEVVGATTLGPAELATMAQETAAVKCKRHSRFKGLRRPSNGCKGCMALYEYARATGVREKRASRKKFDIDYPDATVTH